jgi:hypothetical protein
MAQMTLIKCNGCEKRFSREITQWATGGLKSSGLFIHCPDCGSYCCDIDTTDGDMNDVTDEDMNDAADDFWTARNIQRSSNYWDKKGGGVKKDPTEICRGDHAWRPYVKEGLAFNARCIKCGLVEIIRGPLETWNRA